MSIFGKPGKEAIWKMNSNDLVCLLIPDDFKHDFEVVAVKDEVTS